MGDTKVESMSPEDMIQAYSGIMPIIVQGAIEASKGLEAQRYADSSQYTPGYAQMNTDLYSKYGPLLNQIGQGITSGNRLTDAQTDLDVLQRTGIPLINQAMEVSRQVDPEYFAQRSNASRRLDRLFQTISGEPENLSYQQESAQTQAAANQARKQWEQDYNTRQPGYSVSASQTPTTQPPSGQVPVTNPPVVNPPTGQQPPPATPNQPKPPTQSGVIGQATFNNFTGKWTSSDPAAQKAIDSGFGRYDPATGKMMIYGSDPGYSGNFTGSGVPATAPAPAMTPPMSVSYFDLVGAPMKDSGSAKSGGSTESSSNIHYPGQWDNQNQTSTATKPASSIPATSNPPTTPAVNPPVTPTLPAATAQSQPPVPPYDTTGSAYKETPYDPLTTSLTGSEREEIQRSLNQSDNQRGAGGLTRGANAVAAATNFGNAGYKKQQDQIANYMNALNLDTGFLGQAKYGLDPIQTALGRPSQNPGESRFTGNYMPDQSGAVSLANTGASMTNNWMSGANNAAMQNQNPFMQSMMSGLGSGIGGMCCFIFLEAYNGELPWFVRYCRDKFYTPEMRNGYVAMARVLVPAMRRSRLARWIVNATMIKPLTKWGGWHCGVPGFAHGRKYGVIKSAWFKCWTLMGKAVTR